MAVKQQDIYYALSCLYKTLLRKGFSCPDCGSIESDTVDSKFAITHLRRCKNCSLQFRTPTTSEIENSWFYQNMYFQGLTTETPSGDELDRLVAKNFNGTEKDFSTYIALLDALGVKKGASILDFGCSWGYGSYQFKQAGYSVEAVEISDSRRNYAIERLGVNAHKSLSDVSGKYDCFFSSHVLEHVPSPSLVITEAIRMLKPGGFFVAITPNGTDLYKKQSFESWHRLWGKVHPNMLDDKFYTNNIPYKAQFGSLHNGKVYSDNLSFYEFYCAFQKPDKK